MTAAVASEVLLVAIRNRDAAAVRQQFASDPLAASCTGPNGESLLMHACYVGAAELAPLLRGTRSLDLAEAVTLGDLEAIDRALDQDPDALSRHTADGWTPLHLAGFFGQEEAAVALINAGASLEVRSTNGTRNTPLHAALAGACLPALVKRLVMAGANVAATGEQDITPLHVAASRGNSALCELLISRGAQPHATMTDGTTPAQLATARGFPELAEKLIAMA
jgi:ankyrin repeat protein